MLLLVNGFVCLGWLVELFSVFSIWAVWGQRQDDILVASRHHRTEEARQPSGPDPRTLQGEERRVWKCLTTLPSGTLNSINLRLMSTGYVKKDLTCRMWLIGSGRGRRRSLSGLLCPLPSLTRKKWEKLLVWRDWAWCSRSDNSTLSKLFG